MTVMTVHFTTMPSPIDDLMLMAEGDRLVGLAMLPHPDPGPDWERVDDDPVLVETRHQLVAYFAGERTDFDVALGPEGTAFQMQVWAALRQIPYGETISYGELARRIGNPQASRAVGLANGRNPIAVIVPCHRVIGANGSLTGYGGGLGRKQVLLSLEQGVTVLPV